MSKTSEWEESAARRRSAARQYEDATRDYRQKTVEFLKMATKAKNKGKLTEREIGILRERFGKRKTFEEVGKIFDVTRERIRQIEFKAIMIVQSYEEEPLYEFPGPNEL